MVNSRFISLGICFKQSEHVFSISSRPQTTSQGDLGNITQHHVQHTKKSTPDIKIPAIPIHHHTFKM